MTEISPPRRIEFIARATLRERGRLLLCRNRSEGYLYLPGGHVEPGESAAEACARELHEEAGLEVTVGRCLLVAEMRFTQGGEARHEVNVVFHVERQSAGDAGDVISLESQIDFAWIALTELLEHDVRPISLRNWAHTELQGRASPPLRWLSESE